mgnify:CR=1 FL=1
MKVTEYFEKANGETLISFEVLPPLKGGSMKAIFDVLDPLMEFKPPFIDVTYHREDFIYKQRDGGFYEKVAIRKRPGTVGICAAIMHKYGIEAVPHLICGGFSVEETENALIDLQGSFDMNPENSYSWRNLGAYYLKINEYDKALIHFEKANEIDPLTEMINFYLAQAHLKLDNGEESKKYLKKSLEIKEHNDSIIE